VTKKRSFVRNYAEYGLLRLVSLAVSLLPDRAALGFGEALGALMRAADRRHRRVAGANLAAAFPGQPPREIERLTRGVYRHLGLVLVESLRIGRTLRRGIGKVVEQPDLSQVKELLAEGRGVIVITAHLGNWEIAGHATSELVVPLHSVARPLDNPLLERWVDRMRTLTRQKVIGKRGAVREMLQVLKGGGAVAILMDQDARRHGIFVDFFGRRASTWPTAAALSLKLGCPIVFGFVRRKGRAFRYELVVDSVFRPEPTGDREADIRDLTQRLTARIEDCIRACPEQWLWLHRRWKTQPPAADPAGTAAAGGSAPQGCRPAEG